MSTIVARHESIVDFPCYTELMKCAPGQCLVSDEIVVDDDGRNSKFVVKLYPRGGGHKASHVMGQHTQNGDYDKPHGGFGMAAAIVSPMLGRPPSTEKVGVYLQYLPEHEDDTVDTSFGLRLRGQQDSSSSHRRFDVEWRAAMRFVALKHSSLAQGLANDFGAHIMATTLLSDFMGSADADRDPLQVQVDVTLHRPSSGEMRSTETTDTTNNRSTENQNSWTSMAKLQDIRHTVRAGQVVVPILTWLQQRPRMFQLGVYPGVDYRVMRITDNQDGQDVFYSRPGAYYELKPLYPLVRQLERPWPVRVAETDIPKLVTPNMYNAVSAIGSLVMALTGLGMAFVLSCCISLFFIPSHSMDPTLTVGDVLLVDKVTPRLIKSYRVGDIVLFHPPPALQDIVQHSTNGQRIHDRDLFVKRVAALPGDRMAVTANGHVTVNSQVAAGPRRDLCDNEPLRLIERYIQASDTVIAPHQVAVLGDCAAVSVDSRVWGALPDTNIVGRPLLRLWPLARWGPVP